MGARLPRWIEAVLSAWLIFWICMIVVGNHAGAYVYAGMVGLLGSVGWLVLLRNTAMRGQELGLARSS